MWGLCPLGDLWEWDGLSWRSHDPPEGPAPTWRRSHTFTFDAARGVIELLGGTLDHPDEPWEWAWDGETWSRPARSDPERDGDPGARWSHAAAYAGDRLLLFGGEGSDSSLWEARGGEAVAAGHVFHAAFGAARAEPGSTPEAVSVAWRGAALGGRGRDCALRPLADNGRCPHPSEVVSDYVELDVRYRRPAGRP